MYEVGSVK